MKRYTATVGTKSYTMAQGHPVEELREAMVAAIHAGGAFVDFIVFGNRRIWVLVSPGLPVILEESEVEEDERDTGDVSEPFGLDGYDL
ncbi:hypothetical protein [Labedella endophytica]|uniref:Uncharacterized protein n=1 Tax=Labedella endophytica TaxID=1523160 RepID=A0A3S0X0L6_9MICO|nr:hypothetical protein [Labedella endophytica]RUR03081.1 hypothetical protein ELQ94_00540 [Labedella endophytica]